MASHPSLIRRLPGHPFFIFAHSCRIGTLDNSSRCTACCAPPILIERASGVFELAARTQAAGGQNPQKSHFSPNDPFRRPARTLSIFVFLFSRSRRTLSGQTGNRQLL